MVNNNSSLRNQKTEIDIQAVKFKLNQALETINRAIEICDGVPGIEIDIYIRCASSYLYEAANKAGKGIGSNN
ncbi:MAG: hypothetical protein WC685_02095 [Methylobacter sp.]|jgi:enolase